MAHIIHTWIHIRFQTKKMKHFEFIYEFMYECHMISYIKSTHSDIMDEFIYELGIKTLYVWDLMWILTWIHMNLFKKIHDNTHVWSCLWILFMQIQIWIHKWIVEWVFKSRPLAFAVLVQSSSLSFYCLGLGVLLQIGWFDLQWSLPDTACLFLIVCREKITAAYYSKQHQCQHAKALLHK